MIRNVRFGCGGHAVKPLSKNGLIFDNNGRYGYRYINIVDTKVSLTPHNNISLSHPPNFSLLSILYRKLTGIVSSVDMGPTTCVVWPCVYKQKSLVFQKISIWRNSERTRSGLSSQTLRVHAYNVPDLRIMRLYDLKTTMCTVSTLLLYNRFYFFSPWNCTVSFFSNISHSLYCMQ